MNPREFQPWALDPGVTARVGNTVNALPFNPCSPGPWTLDPDWTNDGCAFSQVEGTLDAMAPDLLQTSILQGYLETGIHTPMARGRSTQSSR